MALGVVVHWDGAGPRAVICWLGTLGEHDSNFSSSTWASPSCRVVKIPWGARLCPRGPYSSIGRRGWHVVVWGPSAARREAALCGHPVEKEGVKERCPEFERVGFLSRV